MTHELNKEIARRYFKSLILDFDFSADHGGVYGRVLKDGYFIKSVNAATVDELINNFYNDNI